MKFLVSWINPSAPSPDKKFLFSWIAYDFRKGSIISEQSNQEHPKQGVYASFLVGNPSLVDGPAGQEVHYDNISESIVCLDQDVSNAMVGASSLQGGASALGRGSDAAGQSNLGLAAAVQSSSKLRIFQFDPFLDSREVNLHVKVLQMYPSPLRQGKVLLYYNITENLL